MKCQFVSLQSCFNKNNFNYILKFLLLSLSNQIYERILYNIDNNLIEKLQRILIKLIGLSAPNAV